MAIATLYHAVSVSSKRLASGGVAVSERHVLRARGGGSRAVDVGSETVGDAALEAVDPCAPAATRLERAGQSARNSSAARARPTWALCGGRVVRSRLAPLTALGPCCSCRLR